MLAKRIIGKVILSGFLAVFICIAIPTNGTAQPWYDSDWSYRMEVIIDNSSNPSTLTDYQVKVLLDNTNFNFSRAQSGGEDIRFTDSDGTTLINHWIESWDSVAESAIVWVKVPNIPASDSTTIYMYYGNAAASSSSNGNQTFEFFDDFETDYSAGTGWTIKQSIPEGKADCAAAVYDDTLYVFGGYSRDNGTRLYLKGTYAYNPSSDTWTQKADMPTGRWGPVAVEYDGVIHVFSGMTASGPTGVHEIYDPVTDTWQSSALGNPLDIPQYGASGAVHPDVLYFPNGKDGYRYWMAYTPYPPQSLENPSVIRSNDGITWTDSGIINPVVAAGDTGDWNDLENPDPDFIYVSDYNRWFMVWNGGDVATNSRKLALAYSSDGKNWTEYDGVPVNGNTNPVILAGDDDSSQSWETSGGISKTSCPTLLYESGTFYLYYVEEASGNNRGRAGYATFSWNNVTNDVENLVRYAGNPTIDLPADTDFNSGCGHLDLSRNPNDSLYYMYVVRQLAGSSSYELALLTSTDMVSWANQGKVLERGASSEWDDQHIYRSCPVVDSTGNIVFFDTKIRLYYSAFGTGGPRIGIADIPETGPPEKFDGNGPSDVPSGLANQGLMGIRYGNRIHLFYREYHYEYDPVTDTYTSRANVPTPRTWGTCALVNDSIYIIGGYSYGTPSGATNVNEVYDPVSNTWTTKTPMPVSKYGVTRENPIMGGKIYVTHGLNGGFHTDNYVYDPSTDTWEQKSPASYPRDGIACGVINNKLYVVGGRDMFSNPYGLIYNEEYNPSEDTGAATPWAFSNSSLAKRDTLAKYEGDYGLLIYQQGTTGAQYAEHYHDFATCAVDVYWNVTDSLGIATVQPQGRICLRSGSTPSYGSLYFYEDSGPKFKWYTGSFTTLQSGSWDAWYPLTIVWNGSNSKVIIDGTEHLVSATQINSDRIYLGLYQETMQYFDLVRVRKYSTPEPIATTGQASSQGAKVYLSPASDTIALDSLGLENIDYDDMGSTAQPLKGYDIKITFDPTIVEVDTAYSGGFLGASSAFFWEILGTDTVKVTEARLDTGGVSGSGTLATIVFRGIGGGTTPLECASVSLRDTLNDPISVTTQAGSLSVDGYLPTMKPIVEAEGQYYNSAPSLSTFGFDDNWGLDDGFYQMDSYAGTWLSLFTDCPDTTWDSTGWAIPGFGALSEGSHTIYFMATDDAGNQEGESGEWSWQFYKDTTAPGSVTGFTAEPGHNKVSMSWANPVGALEGVLIRRAAWDDYPQYDTAAPAYPDSTTAGDSVAFLSPNETTYIDTLPARDIYYYTVFARDSAGNYSSADTLAQDRSTSYWLGDVTDGSGVGNYDGYVDFEDLMIFSGCFGTSEGDAGWEPEFDIGPTDDYSRTGIPEPDDVINFEDLMIFAMNFWMVEPLTQSAKMPSEEALAVELELPNNAPLVGEDFETKLIINNGAGSVKGIHLVIDFDSNSLEFIGVQESDLLKSQEAKVFFKATNANGKLDISMAILGTGVTLAESGEIAILRFKLLSDQVTEIKLSTVDLRDSSNHKIQCTSESTGIVGTKRLLPKIYALHQNYPNPFSVSTDINYQIPEDSKVIMQIYDLTGQLVCNIVDKTQPAGYHTLRWNGKDKTGNEVAPGVYFCRLVVQPVDDGSVDIGKTTSHIFIKKMIFIKRGRL